MTLEQRDGMAAVTVADTGRGIAAENLSNIFRPFFTTKRQGTGLGLSLAQRIVQEHGGHLEVTSAPGKGTQFVMLLPFTRAKEAAAAS